ncbi:uncharacterized protein LOC144578091 [Callithrix jacchus]
MGEAASALGAGAAGAGARPPPHRLGSLSSPTLVSTPSWPPIPHGPPRASVRLPASHAFPASSRVSCGKLIGPLHPTPPFGCGRCPSLHPRCVTLDQCLNLSEPCHSENILTEKKEARRFLKKPNILV